MTIVLPCQDSSIVLLRAKRFFKNKLRKDIFIFLDEYLKNNKFVTVKIICNAFVIPNLGTSYQILKSFETLKLLRTYRPAKSKKDFYIRTDSEKIMWELVKESITQMEVNDEKIKI